MLKRIIYENETGGVSILTPIPTEDLTIEDIASKDVPMGKPYKIIDIEDIPTDRTFRNAWEVDMTSPHGVGLGPEAWFAAKEAK